MNTLYTQLWLLAHRLVVGQVRADLIPDPNNPNRIVTQPDYFRSSTSPGLDQATAFIWTRITNVVFGFLGAAAVILLIWAGIQYITSGGSPDKAKKARMQIISIVVGIIVLVSAYAIISAILGLANKATSAVT